MKRLFIFIMGVMMAVVATSRTFDMKQLGADAKGIKPCTKLINQTIEKQLQKEVEPSIPCRDLSDCYYPHEK